MNIRTSIAALAAAVVLTGASAVSASTVHKFDFSPKPHVSNAASQVFTADTDLDVTVTGKTYTVNDGNFVGGVGIDVENNSSGLISRNGHPSDKGEWHQHAIDSKYADEAMIFDFGKEVTLTSLHFGWARYSSDGRHFYNGGMFRLFVDGVLEGNYWVNKALPSDITGTVFAIGATAFKFSGSSKVQHSYLKLKNMHVTYDAPEVIPLPAAGWMLLAGLGGIAAMKRRRKAV